MRFQKKTKNEKKVDEDVASLTMSNIVFHIYPHQSQKSPKKDV